MQKFLLVKQNWKIPLSSVDIWPEESKRQTKIRNQQSEPSDVQNDSGCTSKLINLRTSNAVLLPSWSAIFAIQHCTSPNAVGCYDIS